MDELEQRLRSTLTSMAEEVSPSHRAWDEQQRRLALKSRRHRFRPVVMAAVAAAAAVLIAVPIVVIQRANAPVEPGALPEASSQPMPTTDRQPQLPDGRPAIKYVPRNGETLVTQPTAIDSKQMDKGKYLATYAYVIETKPAQRLLCVIQAMEGSEINGPDQITFGEADCMPLNQPKPGRYEWGRRQVPTKFLGNSKGVWLYVMSPPAVKMMLRRAESNELIPATTKEFGQDVVLFGAYMNSTKEPKAFTLYNDKGEPFFNGE
nr:hypothetical protein [Kibdelosporangium sp. MJ126-NF4]CEL15926.1 hypothetical protein [Kibdelosporangium sp. MJ126-NF4]CTQ93850.1 hypothetical protein [Kibdelosporangium sp. MJ126-NF4]